jgi:cytochrome P450
VAAGRATLEQYEAQIRREAAARYSAFSEQILAGQNAMDLAAPYIKSVSSLLELPETDVDLFNSHVASAMTKSTPLWQFENDLRADPLWRKTNNARESMFTVAHQVAKDFGLAF